jgi:hypothetical protein
MTEPSSETGEPGTSQTGEKIGDCGGVAICGAENDLQASMRAFSSPMVIRFSGLRSKIIPRMLLSSSDNGKMVFKKFGFLVKALYVESCVEASFHGLRPQVRLTRITPKDQMSFGAHRYDGFLDV